MNYSFKYFPTISSSSGCLRLCLFAFLLLPLKGSQAIAQGNVPPRVTPQEDFAVAAAKLKAPVHLLLGTTTVKAVMVSLSRQTGVTIQAADYLEARKLIVQMDNLSAQEALDTLVELNEWRWINRGNNSVFVTRRRATMPQNLQELPSCLRDAFPKDYRVFLGFGVALNDLPEAKIVTPQGEKIVLRTPDPESDRANRVRLRMQSINEQKSRTLFAVLQPGIMNNQTFLVKDLPLPLQVDLQEALLLQILLTLNNEPYLRLLNTGLTPYQKDASMVEVYLYGGNGLMIGSPIKGGSTFFGTAIPGLKPTPPQIPPLQNPAPPPDAP